MKILNLLFILVLFSCGTPVEKTATKSSGTDSYIQYAKGFSVETRDSITYVEVYNPWNQNALLASYELGRNRSGATTKTTFIQTPIRTTAVLSSTYLGMLAMLDARETVIASGSANWIYDSILYNNYLNGKITNLGNDMTVGAEPIISAQPDVVLKYIYQSPDPIDPIIAKAGIPVVYLIEFMEEHPLGRVEWIKLLGVLLDKQELADSLFTNIELSYNNYRQIAKNSKHRPKVLDGTIYKGTWYAAGGKSFKARLFKDAQADYIWHNDSSTGSMPLSFEAVIQKQQDADYWLNANAKTINELLVIDSRCEIFRALQNKKVYHYNKRANPNGGLDYYETGVVRPDLLLKDLLVILHPGILDEETTYYKQLD